MPRATAVFLFRKVQLIEIGVRVSRVCLDLNGIASVRSRDIPSEENVRGITVRCEQVRWKLM